ncbi:MAG: DUF1365 domain-containing protein [Parvibaculales bacterium]
MTDKAAPFDPNGIYHGQVRHARYQPKRHRFSYSVFSFLLDIDRLEETGRNLKLFSFNRFNLFSFWQKDHGPKDGNALRPFLTELLAAAGLPEPARILILCYPRILGLAFNPITLYYCHDRSGQVCAMIYEVRNTFGGDHIYVVPLRGTDTVSSHSRSKKLHVSPFMSMQASYSFTATPPDDSIKFVIRETCEEKPMLVASFVGKRKKLTDTELVKSFVKHPLMTLKIIAGIHFEAVKLLLKGVPYIKGDNKPKKRISY